jgi:flagellar protein FlbD
VIAATRLNGQKIVLNADLIEAMEERPDATITMTTGNIIIVRESVAELVAKAVEYKASCMGGLARIEER